VEISVDTDMGVLTEKGDRIRGIFNARRTDGSQSSLFSTRFILSRTGEGNETLWGSTWIRLGHGVGLCQFGASAMGERGYNYRDIIQKYFTGLRLSHITSSIKSKCRIPQ
jgi:SpoIID/LytB domain protein